MPSKYKRKRKPTNQCKHVESDQRIWDSTTARRMEELVLHIIRTQSKPRRPFYKQLVQRLNALDSNLCLSMGITLNNSDSTLGSHLRDIRGGKKAGCGILTIDILTNFLPPVRRTQTAGDSTSAEQPQEVSDSEDGEDLFSNQSPRSGSPEQTQPGIKRRASSDTTDCLSPTPQFLPHKETPEFTMWRQQDFPDISLHRVGGDTAPPSPSTSRSSHSFFADTSSPYNDQDDYPNLLDYETDSLCSADEIEEIIRGTTGIAIYDEQHALSNNLDFNGLNEIEIVNEGLIKTAERVIVDEELIKTAERVGFLTDSFNEKNGGLDWLDVDEKIKSTDETTTSVLGVSP